MKIRIDARFGDILWNVLATCKLPAAIDVNLLLDFCELGMDEGPAYDLGGMYT